MKHSVIISLVLILFVINTGKAQIKEIWQHKRDSCTSEVLGISFLQITKEEFMISHNGLPNFGMFHDNYFITGVPTNKKINGNTADAKYQISIRQRLIKSILPLNSILLLTYTQKSFWDIYLNSSPFAESNYNPGLSLAKPVIIKDKLMGMAVLSAEHESNGLDSIGSRSWNYIALSTTFFYNANISIQTKLWLGVLDIHNDDLFDYRGLGILAINYRNNKGNIWCSAVLNPTKNFKTINTTLEFNYKVSKNYNQYLFVQWYNGYGEKLTNYKEYASMIRAGICIKPFRRNFY